MTADEVMADVMAGVAVAQANRTGLIQFVEHNGACWGLHAQGAPQRGDSLAVVLPREDRVGVAKRILGARLSGLCVPQSVLALVHAEKRPEPKPTRPTKAEIAASISPPVEPEDSPVSNARPAPVPHEVKSPATVQGEMW